MSWNNLLKTERYKIVVSAEILPVSAKLVRTEQLADFASKIDLGRAMRLGQGEIVTGGRSRRALLCAGFEALVGGIYLDRGVKAVEDFFEPYIQEAIEEILVDGHPRDPKSLLQEWTQARGKEPPEYQTIRESGPDHEKVFEVNVSINGLVSGIGIGNSKREASKLAAQEALDKLSQLNNHKKKGN